MADYDVKFVHLLLYERLFLINKSFSPAAYMKKVMTTKTNLERFNLIYEDLKKFNLLPTLVQSQKDDAKSNEFVENGNRFFFMDIYMVALDSYTRGVAYAKSQKALALAYSNRSLCLFKLGMYQQCLTDIERALAHNYPEHLKPKLLSRREKALALQKPVEAFFEEIPEIPESERNPLIQSASNSVKIEENAQYGRHIVATRKIEIGEVIAVEKAFASVLNTDRLIHCHDCLMLCYNPIPCDGCTVIFFCSQECKEKALNSYHKYECPILPTLIQCGLEKKLIDLKVALLAKEDYLNLDGVVFDKREYYRSDRFKEIHCLRVPKNPEVEHELFFDAIKGAVIYDLLKEHTNFFGSKQMEDMFKKEILFLFQSVVLNGVKISEYTELPLLGYDDIHFASGVFSFFSLFNHSCCHNVSRSYHGSTIVLRTNSTIEKEQQLFVNYGFHYGTVPKYVRQKSLMEDYSFLCKCRACEEDWGLLGHPSMFLQNCQRANRGYRDDPSDLSPIVLLALEKELSSNADVAFAKESLIRLVAKLKRIERRAPSAEILIIQQMLSYCYGIFGNKRRK